MAVAHRITNSSDVEVLVGVASPLYAAISASTSGDNTVVAATSGFRIRVIKCSYVCASAVVVTWKSSVAGAISGPESYAANGGMSEPYCPAGIMQTAIGEGLVINLGGNVSVGGKMTYILVPNNT